MSDRLEAVKLVVKLVTVFKMPIMSACRISATRNGVDYDWLYRQITE